VWGSEFPFKRRCTTKGGGCGAHAIVRGGARCAFHVLHRCAQAEPRAATHQAMHTKSTMMLKTAREPKRPLSLCVHTRTKMNSNSASLYKPDTGGNEEGEGGGTLSRRDIHGAQTFLQAPRVIRLWRVAAYLPRVLGFLAPHINGSRDVPRCGALSSLQKPQHNRGVQRISLLGRS
jgi:hypothetical protein